MASVDPRRLDDEALAAKTAPYRVVEIQYRAEATGRGGPGDLAWVWFALLAWWLAERLRHH